MCLGNRRIRFNDFSDMCNAWTPHKIRFKQLERRLIALRVHFHISIGRIPRVAANLAMFRRSQRKKAVSDPLNASTNNVVLCANHFSAAIVAFD